MSINPALDRPDFEDRIEFNVEPDQLSGAFKFMNGLLKITQSQMASSTNDKQLTSPRIVQGVSYEDKIFLAEFQ